jgi:1-acyl-sn-glycerol-3-phosphate acyltransferase
VELAAPGAGLVATAPASDGSGAADAGRGRRLAEGLQGVVGRLTAPVAIPLAVLLIRFGFGWRIRDAAPARALYVRLLRESRRPLLVVANHLTMADSPLIAWGLGSAFSHVRRYRGLPWNVPEQSRVESSWLWRVLAYLAKCVPIPRGGDRRVVAQVLERLERLMRDGEVVLMFPEGGRSRTGRIDAESVAQGVGRLIRDLGDCRVLCVYLRGDAQRTWSNLPARGDTFSIAARLVEPTTALRGLRASRDLVSQIVGQLAEMEREYFSERPGPDGP